MTWPIAKGPARLAVRDFGCFRPLMHQIKTLRDHKIDRSRSVGSRLFLGGHSMTRPIARDTIYRRRRFPREVIETCVRWYLTYRLSYRDLSALMAEQGI